MLPIANKVMIPTIKRRTSHDMLLSKVGKLEILGYTLAGLKWLRRQLEYQKPHMSSVPTLHKRE
jgi:hypothetical protein